MFCFLLPFFLTLLLAKPSLKILEYMRKAEIYSMYSTSELFKSRKEPIYFFFFNSFLTVDGFRLNNITSTFPILYVHTHTLGYVTYFHFTFVGFQGKPFFPHDLWHDCWGKKKEGKKKVENT